jgi:hypothetical protein
MDQNDINIAMVTGNVSPLARFLLEAFRASLDLGLLVLFIFFNIQRFFA